MLAVDECEGCTAVVVSCSMGEGLVDGDVGILKVVLADEAYAESALSIFALAKEGEPRTEVGMCIVGVDAELAQHSCVESLFLHLDRHLVDAGQVGALHHAVFRHIAEGGHFVHEGARQFVFGSEDKDVWLDAKRLQVVDGVLCRFCLQFTCSSYEGHVGEVYAHSILLQFPSQLAYGFEEGKALDVSDGTSYLCDDEVVLPCVAESLHVALYLIGDVRDDLYGASEVTATALSLHDILVDASCGDVVGTCGLYACEALIVSEVEVCFLSVDGDVALSVFVGIECAWVNVDVGVVLLDGDAVAACLQEFA